MPKKPGMIVFFGIVMSTAIGIYWFNRSPHTDGGVDMAALDSSAVLSKVPQPGSSNLESQGDPATELPDNIVDRVDAALAQLPTVDVTQVDQHVPNMEQPLRSRYSDLASKATNGDANAALELAGALSICAIAPRSTEAFEQQSLNIYQTRRVEGSSARVEDLDGEIRKLRSKFLFCDGISKEEYLDHHQYMKMAAEAGNIEAKVRLIGYGPLHIKDVYAGLSGAKSAPVDQTIVFNSLST